MVAKAGEKVARVLANITRNSRHSILLFLPFLQVLSSQTTAPHTLRRPDCASWPSKRRQNTTAWKNTHTHTHTHAKPQRDSKKSTTSKEKELRTRLRLSPSIKNTNRVRRHVTVLPFSCSPSSCKAPSSAVQTRAQARPLGPERPYFGLHTRGSQLALPPCCHARPPGQVVTFGWSSQLFSYKEQRKERAMREDSGS